MFQFVIEWSQGNPGALVFLMRMFEQGNEMIALRVISKLEKSSIRGTDLYVLYSDLANKDLNTVVSLVEDVPMDILEDACSRQDYSGRKLIADYIAAPHSTSN